MSAIVRTGVAYTSRDPVVPAAPWTFLEHGGLRLPGALSGLRRGSRCPWRTSGGRRFGRPGHDPASGLKSSRGGAAERIILLMRRAAVVVLDACGVGALPDAEEYGDAGSNTLAHVADAVGGLELPVLQSLGLGNVTPIRGVEPVARPVVHGRLWPLGPGKDTTAG